MIPIALYYAVCGFLFGQLAILVNLSVRRFRQHV